MRVEKARLFLLLDLEPAAVELDVVPAVLAFIAGDAVLRGGAGDELYVGGDGRELEALDLGGGEGLRALDEIDALGAAYDPAEAVSEGDGPPAGAAAVYKRGDCADEKPYDYQADGDNDGDFS